MRKLSLTLILSSFALIFLAEAQSNRTLNIIAIGAHPDDCDSKFGGTAALFAEMGHRVKFVALTNGDAGHQAEGGGALGNRRRAEAQEAGKALGIAYDVLDNHDGELLPTLQVRHQVIRKIREWDADIVLGLRPNDYHPDHRNAGKVVQDAAYMVVVPNVTPDTPPLRKNPLFLYMQDPFKKPNPFSPDIVVAIDKTIEKKIDALHAHTSQMYEWLPWVNGNLDEVPKDATARREWLANRVKSRGISREYRAGLIKWYGEGKGKSAKNAEAFEIAEYGYQPTESEIRTYFPMLEK
ncbi:PIG-L family deacetylase [Fulvivirga sp. M361]|uniref:PIG-L deacetylase family protein n=1 Tax=Fulvivirga sp. M361 TaxID=2594266 RepID=UPI00117B8268|nr:PIG-L family deacetylase [Fulvivirga sp. M361]TRX59939.1 PIG-L family deacetylase [Fulvivirga sp. M361]